MTCADGSESSWQPSRRTPCLAEWRDDRVSASGLHRFQDRVGGVEIRVHVLHVVVLFQGGDESQDAAGGSLPRGGAPRGGGAGPGGGGGRGARRLQGPLP